MNEGMNDWTGYADNEICSVILANVGYLHSGLKNSHSDTILVLLVT